jgi:hypothetical protein
MKLPDVRECCSAKDVHFNIPACVVVKFHHNHDLDSVEVLKKRDVGPDVRAKFEKLFEAGHSPSSALETHKYDLQMEEGSDFAAKLNDRRYCPDIQWCFRIYYKMFEAEYGPMSLVEMALSLQQRVDQFNGELGERTVAFHAVEDYVVIAVCTPLMKRVHRSVGQSAHSVFVDSSRCVDSKNECRVFLLMTCCTEMTGGGLPLGVVITTSEQERAVGDGFELLKTLLPDGAFHGRTADAGPATFFTDDCSALRSSLSRIFLQSSVLLNQFHVLWDVWRWLWAPKNGVAIDHRSHLYQLTEAAVRSETCQALAEAFTRIYNDSVAESYDKFIAHVNQLLDRSTLWASCYQNVEDRRLSPGGLVTVEQSASLQKDKIFNRLKSFSPVQLVDFTVSRLERYFERRLRTACRHQEDARHGRRCHFNFPKDSRVALENVWMLSPNVVLVPSETPVSARHAGYYAVNTTLWVCTCPVGSRGAPCKHQWASVTKYPTIENDCLETQPAWTLPSARKRMYFIATGLESAIPENWLSDAKDFSDPQQTVLAYIDDTTSAEYDDMTVDDAMLAVMKMAPGDDADGRGVDLVADDDDGEVARTISRFMAFSSEMAERISLDPDTYLEPAKSFLSSYESITTNAGLVSALRCFGEYSRAASAVIAGRKRKALALTNKTMRESGLATDKKVCH